MVDVKLIFLDIDGPILPWRRGKSFNWNPEASLDRPVNVENVSALRRIIDGAGGPDIVKVVISSNWRTDESKYPWLVDQLDKLGVEVLGHTDVVNVHPAGKRDGGVLARNLEIQRALNGRIIGTDGPVVGAYEEKMFKSFCIPDNWNVTTWIAIDDLGLHDVRAENLSGMKLYSCFISLSGDEEVGNGWLALPQGFKADVQEFTKMLSTSHFVQVQAEQGIAGTPGAEQLAIQLLGRPFLSSAL